MATYSEPPTSLGAKIALTIIVLVALAAVVTAVSGGFKQPPQPCSTYKEATLTELPAKCITPQGGYNPQG
jgi:hypothetical protein